MAVKTFVCKGSCSEECGLVPDETGRFIRGCRNATVWVLCRRHATVYHMNIAMALACGDQEVTRQEAERLVMSEGSTG